MTSTRIVGHLLTSVKRVIAYLSHGASESPYVGEFDVQLGRRIAARRIELGIERQEDLAVMIGVDRTQIGRWEAGKNTIGADNLAQLAKVLRVSSDWLLNGLPGIEERLGEIERRLAGGQGEQP